MIIAEIGQNFCGDMALARKLIDLAKENGADLAKFQLYDSKKLYGEYQPTELTKEQAFDLFNYGKQVGIEVFFSVFDVERVGWCEEMGVKRYKIAFSQKDNLALLALVHSKGEVFVSSDDYYAGQYVLYCIPEYPTSIQRIDFERMQDFDGLSDHTIGLDAAKIALARGATIIEKHFAIDHKTGIDAAWSMTPEELKELKRFEGVVRQVL